MRQSVTRHWLIGAALALASAFFVAVWFQAWTYDDPFITYRYAANLLAGQGFIYNPGEHVLSTTTPLFTLLLAALGSLWPNLPGLANVIGAVSLAAGALCLWDLACSWGSPVAGWVGLVLYPTFPLMLMTLGSEVPLYLALCLGAFAFYARGRLLAAAVCAALAVFARADGMLVPALLAGDYLLRARAEGRRVPWAALAVFLVLTVPWFLFAARYFGSPLPATLFAKQRQGAMAISQRFAPGLLTVIGWYAGSWQHWAQAALAAGGMLFALRRARRWLLFLVWPVLYFAAYSLLGVSRYYWYYAPLVPGFLAAAGLGAEWLMASVRKQFERAAWLQTAGAAGLAALALAQGVGAYQLSRQPDNRMAIYRAVGEWLAANTPAEATVGALEVGAIGYYAQRPMIDFAGLLQPAVAAQLTPASTYEDSARWALYTFRPDYLVLSPSQFPVFFEAEGLPNCQVANSFEGAAYAYPGTLTVFACAW